MKQRNCLINAHLKGLSLGFSEYMGAVNLDVANQGAVHCSQLVHTPKE